MSEIAPTYTASQNLPVLSWSLPLPVKTTSAAWGALRPDFGLPSASNTANFIISGYRAEVPHTAAVLYQLVFADGATIPATYLHLRQKSGGQMTLEARIMGRISAHPWALAAIGLQLNIITTAQNIAGAVITTDLLMTAEIENIANLGDRLQLYAISTMPPRAPQTIAISTILFVQDRSSGKRSIRCPIVWGVQAGDTLTHPDMNDFVIETLSMTISRKYSVIDATEVQP